MSIFATEIHFISFPGGLQAIRRTGGIWCIRPLCNHREYGILVTKFTNKGGNPKEEDGMSCITNESRHKNGVLQAIREQPEHHAMRLYLLCDKTQKRRLVWEDFAATAIRFIKGHEVEDKEAGRT